LEEYQGNVEGFKSGPINRRIDLGAQTWRSGCGPHQVLHDL